LIDFYLHYNSSAFDLSTTKVASFMMNFDPMLL